MKRLLLICVVFICAVTVKAQLLTWAPAFPKDGDATQNLVITVDATKGNQGLLNHTPTNDVYVHIGVITNLSTSATDWKYVPFTWGSTPAAAQAISIGNNKWTYTINGSLRSFFGITNPSETIQKVVIIFRSGNGSKKQVNTDNSDMYIPVYTNALAVRFTQPPLQPTYNPIPEPINKAVGDNINLTAISNNAATLRLYLNGSLIQTANNATSVSANPTLTTAGNQVVVVEAADGVATKTDTLRFFVASNINIAPLPAGAKEGINYDANNTSVTLVLNAPNKGRVSVIGEFPGAGWAEQTQYIMNKTPDGKYWWLRINNLTPGTEYAYQYLVDGSLRIADPYTEKILDPLNDQFVPAATYPALKPYPAGATGIVSVLQTAQPAYNWSVTNFTKPDKRGLIIYELLLRDFLAAHDWKTLRDTLPYLRRMGVNAIEVMPFNEFEGNISWGYNGYQYFAPDKYYGTKNQLKEFIDSCHKNGIAVIMDIVLNHTYGPSPLALLYWDPVNNRPAANNPWYNPVQPHAFGFGEDFNHESQDTKNFFNRVVQHWLTEYKIDGYRIDFSKGLTQRTSGNDGAFSAYDASRIAIINGYANAIKAVSPNAYIILEHFADNQEEKELADAGFMLWSSVWTQYQEAAMGYLGNSNFERGIHTVKGWNHPHLVTFMESHDEERIVYKNVQFGNQSNASYNVRHIDTALRRSELNAVFLLSIPGPKMIWQFGELGYDYSINTCENGTVNNNCRTSPKPIRWDYLQNAKRKQVYDLYAKMNGLRFHPLFKDAFMSNRVTQSLAGGFKWLQVTTDTSNIVVIGNFDVNATSGTVTFPYTGTWYNYLNNSTLNVTSNSQTFNLAPGEYRVYINRNLNSTPPPPPPPPAAVTTFEAKLYPNPTSTTFNVHVKLPESSDVTVVVSNTLGQTITTKYAGVLSSGTHLIPMDPHGLMLMRGIYQVTVRTRLGDQKLRLTIN